MNTIRRLYLYAVAFISLIVITWGLIGLARSAFAGEEIGNDVARLAGALALIFVGIPVFLLHWWLAQRYAHRDNDERFSYIRAFFLYGGLLVTLIPITQNLMALINRWFFTWFDLTDERLIFGYEQTLSDNLVAMLMNVLIGAYVFSILRKDWAAEPDRNTFSETRRFYRYIWVLYGLGLMIAGVQQILIFIFDSLGDAIITSQTILANGVTLTLVGIPIWILSWRVVQKSITDPSEQGSLLRAVILLAVSLIGMVAALSAFGIFLDQVLQVLFGVVRSTDRLIGNLRDPISVVIPFGVAWMYYNRVRRRDVAAFDPIPRHLNGVQQIYVYLSAFLGLITFFVGVQQLIFFIINLLVEQPIWANINSELSVAITLLIIGLPLWLLNWRKAQIPVVQEGEVGSQARGSLVRKVYLYLVLFISVMGVMISAGLLIFSLLQAVLGDPEDNLLQVSLENASLVILFSLVLLYHWQVLRRDGQLSSLVQAEQHADFPILILVSELGIFSEMLVAALKKEAPTMPVAVHEVGLGVPDEALSDAQAVILPANITTTTGEAIRLWLQNFTGTRFVLQTPEQGWVWVSGHNSVLQRQVQQTVEMVKKLAEGEEISQIRPASPWLIFSYLLGGVLGLFFLMIAFSILIDVLN